MFLHEHVPYVHLDVGSTYHLIIYSLTRCYILIYSFIAVFIHSLFFTEVGTITLSKFILLDPLLLFFIMASFHGFTFMHEAADR